ncbi:endolytic transglycosylase MltG [Algivirga pacifica]|uniref:Endolytic murein transglycosylase n=1 Tax=Algivirga pacifica TaxID=1162670 RepID=A0ABP9DMQ5_9BACT
MDNNTKKKIYLFVGLSAVVITVAVYVFQIFFTANINVGKKHSILLIPEGGTIKNVQDSLNKHQYVEEIVPFMFVSKLMKFHENVKPGRYLLRNDMTNIEAIRLLRSGNQEPVKVTFNNARTLEDLAPKITRNLQCSAVEFMDAIKDEAFLSDLGYDSLTVKAIFIPNTYELYWNTDAKALIRRMDYEYKRFWNDERKAQADKIGLTPFQVSVLASIVQAETIKPDEKPKVAGLYINRLNRNMLLQSDPTLVYAHRDFEIKRVLNIHKEINSPYNTYKFKGLPPAPINVPEIGSLKAVLNHEKHKYLYMCAKEDFSGYHNFARTLREHNNNAIRYQRALNRARIYR